MFKNKDTVLSNMEVTTLALIIIVLGVICIILEAFNPGGYLIIPGTVMTIIGICGYISPDLLTNPWMIVPAIILLIAVSVATVYLYRFLGSPAPPSTTITSSLIGRTGTVIKTVEKGSLKGKVRIDSDIWSADSDTDIEEGASVEVVSAEGVHITVRRTE